MPTGRFAVGVDHRGKIKEGKNIKKYFNLARELKNLKNRKMMLISFTVVCVGMVLKCLEKRTEEESKLSRCWMLTYRSSLTSCINCVGGMQEESWTLEKKTLNSLVTLCEHDAGVSVKISHKSRGWHSRRRCVHVQRVRNKLVEMRPREFVRTSTILYNHGGMDPKRERHRGIPNVRPCMCASRSYLVLSFSRLPVRTFCVINEKEKKSDKVLIRFIVFHSYTTQTTALRSIRTHGRFLEIWKELLSLRLLWRTSRSNWCEKLGKSKNSFKINKWVDISSSSLLSSSSRAESTEFPDSFSSSTYMIHRCWHIFLMRSCVPKELMYFLVAQYWHVDVQKSRRANVRLRWLLFKLYTQTTLPRTRVKKSAYSADLGASAPMIDR